MVITNANQAREWLASWGAEAFTWGRAERLAKDMDRCAIICRSSGRYSEETIKGYEDAARVLREAQAAHDATRQGASP